MHDGNIKRFSAIEFLTAGIWVTLVLEKDNQKDYFHELACLLPFTDYLGSKWLKNRLKHFHCNKLLVVSHSFDHFSHTVTQMNYNSDVTQL